MTGRPIDRPLFSPREAVLYHAAQRASRDQQRRPGQPETPRETTRRVGEAFTTGSVGRALRNACDAAGVPRVSPHQLRHLAATRLRRELGLEVASLTLGHASATLTDAVYAERNARQVTEAMRRIG